MHLCLIAFYKTLKLINHKSAFEHCFNQLLQLANYIKKKKKLYNICIILYTKQTGEKQLGLTNNYCSHLPQVPSGLNEMFQWSGSIFLSQSMITGLCF